MKGNPNASRNVMLKYKNVTRAPAKKIAWDHPRLPSTKDKILELLHGYVNQFLSGGYNGMPFQNKFVLFTTILFFRFPIVKQKVISSQF